MKQGEGEAVEGTGIGEGKGENRAMEAAKRAVASPLLEVSIEGAKGILFTITGSKDLTMHEVSEAAKIITSSADPNAKIIYGVVIDPELKEVVKITVVATGFPSLRTNLEPPKEPSFIPPPFLTKIKRTLPEMSFPKKEERKPVTASKDDELEIPAFIRRKML